MERSNKINPYALVNLIYAPRNSVLYWGGGETNNQTKKPPSSVNICSEGKGKHMSECASKSRISDKSFHKLMAF